MSVIAENKLDSQTSEHRTKDSKKLFPARTPRRGVASGSSVWTRPQGVSARDAKNGTKLVLSEYHRSTNRLKTINKTEKNLRYYTTPTPLLPAPAGNLVEITNDVIRIKIKHTSFVAPTVSHAVWYQG